MVISMMITTTMVLARLRIVNANDKIATILILTVKIVVIDEDGERKNLVEGRIQEEIGLIGKEGRVVVEEIMIQIVLQISREIMNEEDVIVKERKKRENGEIVDAEVVVLLVDRGNCT